LQSVIGKSEDVPPGSVALMSATYEDVVGIFSEDGKFRLDIGTDTMKKNVAADHNSWATRLRIKPL
jgi:hypothetical protein